MIRFSEHIAAEGPDVFAHACRLGAEGIVSKRLGSAYNSGLCHAWVKVKNPDAVAPQRSAGRWNRCGGSSSRTLNFAKSSGRRSPSACGPTAL
jgi:hypothetical protein